MPDVATLFFAGTTVGLGVTTLAGLVLWRRVSAFATGLSHELDELRDSRDRLNDELTRVRTEHQEVTQAFEAAEERKHASVHAAREAQQRLARANDRIRSLEQVGRDLEQARLNADTEASRRRTELANQSHELAHLRVAARHVRQLLEAIGLRIPEDHHNPLAPDRRPTTRNAIQTLAVDTGAIASSLVRTSGLVVYGVGQEAGVGRIATAAAELDALRPELEAVLCAPVGSYSVVDRRFCTHLLRVPETGLLIGVDSLGEAPMFAMQRAHLTMVELPSPPGAVAQTPASSIDLDDAPDEALSGRLAHWASRHGVDAVTLLSGDGRPLAATPSAQPGEVMALRRALGPTMRRMVRDGRPLDDITLVVRAVGGGALSLKWLGADMEAPLVAAIGSVEVPEHELDELAGTLRWHTPSTQSSREAS